MENRDLKKQMQCQDLSFNSLISSRRQKEDSGMIFSNSQRPCNGEDSIVAMKSNQTTLGNDDLDDGEDGVNEEEGHIEQNRNDFSFQEEFKRQEFGNYQRNKVKKNLTEIQQGLQTIVYPLKDEKACLNSSTQKTYNTDKQFEDKKMTIQTSKSKQNPKHYSNNLICNLIKNDVRGASNDMPSSISLMNLHNNIQKKLLTQDDMQTKKIWRFHFFKMLFLTNRFIFKMKKILVFRHPEQLKREQQDAINDKSNFAIITQIKQEKSFIPRIRSRWRKRFDIFSLSVKKKLKSFSRPLWTLKSVVGSSCQQLGNKIPLFEPLHPLFLLWDCLVVAQIIFNLLLIPLEISFSVSLSEGFQLANYIFFVLDLLTSLNTTLFLQGESEKRRWPILKNYVHQRLWVEVLCLICLRWKEPLGFQIFRMFYVMKVKDLTFRMDKIREISRLDDQYVQVINLYILLFQILYLCHIFGCLWYKLGAYVNQDLQKPSWLDQYNGEHLEKYELYANSIYFAVVTITTIGYGDISPIHPFERMFVIFMALLSCVSFGYALNQIGSLIAESNAKQLRFREKLAILNKYMTEAKVSPDLQNLARKDLKFTQEERSKRGITAITALSTLSLSLQTTIKQEVNVRLLQSVKQLNSNFSLPFLKRLSLCLEEKTFISGEVIQEQERLHSPSLFILTQGKVQLSIKHSHSQMLKHFKKIHSQSSFGVYEFLIQTYSPIFTATSLGPATVVCLDIKDFLKELEEFPSDKETYSHMKDQLLFVDSFQKFDLNCVSCKSTSHLSNHCHLLGYHPNKLKIISDHLDQEEHQISSFIRPYKSKFSSVGRIQDVEQSVKQFIIEETNQISELDKLANQNKQEQLDFKHPTRSLSNIQFTKQLTSKNTQLRQTLLHSSSFEMLNNPAFQHQESIKGLLCKPKVPPEKSFGKQNSTASSYYVQLPLNWQSSQIKGSEEQIIESQFESCDSHSSLPFDQVNEVQQLNGDHHGSLCQDSQLVKPLHVFEVTSNEFIEQFMESIKSFKIYFPHNNIEVILLQQEKMLKSKKIPRNGTIRYQRAKNKLHPNDAGKASTFSPNMFLR